MNGPLMKKSQDFHPYVPDSAYQHGDAGLVNPVAQSRLFTPWEELYSAPFDGISTDGQVGRGDQNRKSTHSKIIS
jgi:hypothetical protein